MSIFNIISCYDEAWKAIIMPGRQEYSIHDLGPTDFVVKDQKVKRTDFRLLNKRGHILECSFFQHVHNEDPAPCVIYLHANGCCRLEALQYADMVLSCGISLFCFDFSGCGKSDGTYSSVGWFEQEDLECIIQYVYNTGRVSRVAVWGRSMGAITTILYAEKDPRISCVILDSPFANFKQLVKEVAKRKASIPEFLATGAFNMMRKTILKKANFDIDALRPIKYVDKIRIPALFGTAKGDTFVLPQHTRDLYMAYAGPKEMMIFEGDHNSDRPINWLLLVKKFLQNHLFEEKASPSFKLHSVPLSSRESATKSTSESLTDLAENQKGKLPQKTLRRTPNPDTIGNSQPERNMTFTWLEHSASSPQLLTAAEVFKNDASKQNYITEMINNENASNQTPSLKLRLLENRFQSSTTAQNKSGNTSMQGYPIAQSTYTIEPVQKVPQKPVKIEETKKPNASQGNTHQDQLKMTKQIFKANSDQPKASTFTNQEPLSQILNSQPSVQNLGKNGAVDPKQQIKPRNDISHNVASNTNVKKVDAPLKAKQPIYTIEPQTKPAKNPNIPGPVTSVTKGFIPQPKANQVGDPPSLNFSSQMQSYTELYPENIPDYGNGRSINETTSTSLSRNVSVKSFTSAADYMKQMKEDTSPGLLQRRKPLMFQVALNSSVPFINPTQTASNININFLTSHSNNVTGFRDDRRSSDNNSAHVLKALMTTGTGDKSPTFFRPNDEKGVYLSNKLVSK